ncbi:MAG: DUF2282 domain-containing protein [Thiomonas sp.]|nr:DUF2282 domain-containing protein [Thiomonas sp.]
MNKRQVLHTAAASLLAMGALSLVPAAQAQSMDKCFGIAKAGQNDCAGISGLHSCKGTSTTSYDPGDFAVKPTGTCKEMGGLNMEQAKALLKNPAEVKMFEEKMAKKMSM